MFTGVQFTHFIQANPALAVFLTVALGFLLGKLRIRSFSLGTVTSVLLVGVVVGQLRIEIPEPAKTLFFLMFLFAVGYAVGPQFFRGLKKDGLPQVAFAVVFGFLQTDFRCVQGHFFKTKEIFLWNSLTAQWTF